MFESIGVLPIFMMVFATGYLLGRAFTKSPSSNEMKERLIRERMETIVADSERAKLQSEITTEAARRAGVQI